VEVDLSAVLSCLGIEPSLKREAMVTLFLREKEIRKTYRVRVDKNKALFKEIFMVQTLVRSLFTHHVTLIATDSTKKAAQLCQIQSCSSELQLIQASLRDVGQYEMIKTTFNWRRWCNSQRRSRIKYRMGTLERLTGYRRVLGRSHENLVEIDLHDKVREFPDRTVPVVVDCEKLDNFLKVEAFFLQRGWRDERYMVFLRAQLDRNVFLALSSRDDFLIIPR